VTPGLVTHAIEFGVVMSAIVYPLLLPSSWR